MTGKALTVVLPGPTGPVEVALPKRFDPRQRRDRQGRWTDTGGGEAGGGEVAAATEALQALLPEGTKISRLDIETGQDHDINRLVLHRPGYEDPHEFEGGAVRYRPGEGQHIGHLTWRSDTGEITDVEVEPEYKRRGIATAMLRLARAQAEAEGTAKPKHSENQEPEGAAWARTTEANLRLVELEREIEALNEILGAEEGFVSGRVTAPKQRRLRRLYDERRKLRAQLGKRFDPHQPRDDHGRWSETPGTAVLGGDVLTDEGGVAATKFPLFADPADERGLDSDQTTVSVRALNSLGGLLKVPRDQRPVSIASANDDDSAEMHYEGSAARVMLLGGLPLSIELPRTIGDEGAKPHDVLHEMGHALDYGVFRERHASEELPLSWAEWQEVGGADEDHPLLTAIAVSPEVALMEQFRDAGYNREAGPSEEELKPPRSDNQWDEVSLRGKELTARYAADPKETFARAFAQWVALRSGDEEAMSDLQDPDNWPINGYAWSEENFAPIAEAFDEFFEAEGMLR